MHTEQLYPAVCFCTDAVKRESPYNRSTAFRVRESISVKLCPGIHLSPKVNWNRISFWKYFKIKFFGRKITSAPHGQIFAVTKSKNSAYCWVHHFKVLYFQRFFFFSLPRIKSVLKWCKAHNFGPSKAFHIYQNVFDLHSLCRRRERCSNAYFHPSTVQNSHIF